MSRGYCRYCGCSIVFAHHRESGKAMVFEQETAYLLEVPAKHRWQIQDGVAFIDEDPSRDPYVPHHATCPVFTPTPPKTPYLAERWQRNHKRRHHLP